jgi:H+/Cl- antiporter ClcA
VTETAVEQQPRMSGGAYLKLIGLGALIGIPAALLAAIFLALIHELEDLLWHDLPDALGYDAPPWFLIVGLPVVGAAFVLTARRVLPGDGGHRPLDGFSTSAAPTRVSYAPSVALAAIGTLAFGAVLGPEAPLIALGSAVGLVVTHFVDVDPAHHRILAMAGAFAAISALFGGPIAAGILLIEAGIGLGSLLIPLIIPGLVAAAVGYLLFTGFGNWGGLEETTLSVPGLPPYDGVDVGDLLVAIVGGVLIALVIEIVLALGWRVAAEEERAGTGKLLLAGGLVVGVIALVADALGENSQNVLFSGQAAIPALVAETSAGSVAVLLVAKGLAYAVSLGCGFRGGQVFPAIFLGIAVAMLAVIWFDVSPTLAVAVGTAAGSAAVTRLLFASIVIGAILVGSAGADAVPAAILAGVAAWVTVMAIERRAAPGEAEAGAEPA